MRLIGHLKNAITPVFSLNHPHILAQSPPYSRLKSEFIPIFSLRGGNYPHILAQLKKSVLMLIAGYLKNFISGQKYLYFRVIHKIFFAIHKSSFSSILMQFN
jgi:hypothetical protein